MRFPVFVLLLGLTVPLPVWAQQAPAPSFTIDAALRLAIGENPRLRAAAENIAASRAGVRSARALSNPNVLFTPGVTSISGTTEEVLVSQPLEINGIRQARAGVARAEVRVAQAASVAELRTIVFETRSAYIELARARELQKLAADALAEAEEFDRIARRQVELGSRPGVDLAQTGLEVTRARQQATLAGARVTAGQTTLNALLARPMDTPISDLSPLAFDTAFMGEEASLTEQALAARPEVERQRAEGDVYRETARLVRAEGRPDIAPMLRVGSLLRGVPGPDTGNGFGVGVSISLPIFDYGSRRERVRQAEASARARDYSAESVRLQVRQEVAQALARLRAAQTIAESYQSEGGLERARRLLDASRVGFREGQTSVLAVLEAQRTFRALQTDYRNALADAAIARAELERATAAPLPPAILPSDAVSEKESGK